MSELEFVVHSPPLDCDFYAPLAIRRLMEECRERGHGIEWSADARVLSVAAASPASADNALRELLNEALVATLNSREVP